MAALQAPRRQMRAGATQAMRDIAEERGRSRWPAPPATLRAGGDCGAISASLVVNDVTTSPPPRSLISHRKPHQRHDRFH